MCVLYLAVARRAGVAGGGVLLPNQRVHSRFSQMTSSIEALKIDEYVPERIPINSASTKLRMLACHATQERVWRWFPLEVERFRVAPHYDFTRLPEPPLYYERFDWNMDGARFIELARSAHRELGLESEWRRY